MYSRGHAAVAAAVGIPVAAFAPPDHSPVLLWAFVVLLGVGIDVDHFLVARLERGDWTNARRCLRDPSLVFGDQTDIFDAGDLYRDQRLLSHHLIGGALVAVLWPVAPYWALAAAVAVYTHVLADLYSDARTRARYLRRSVETVGDAET